MVKILVEQEIQHYSGADYFDFWIYGHELRERQKDGWYIKEVIRLSENTCSILWEKLLTPPQESDPT